jgi:hypothetical protein
MAGPPYELAQTAPPEQHVAAPDPAGPGRSALDYHMMTRSFRTGADRAAA